jgi:hypothetical protein
VLRNFLFRVCFCKIFVCLVFLSFPALRVDLNHKAMLRLLLRCLFLGHIVIMGRLGEDMRIFVLCNSNRRSLSRDCFRELVVC